MLAVPGVPVVPKFHLRHDIGECVGPFCSEPLQVIGKILEDLGMCIAQHLGILCVEGDVVQVVEVGENGHLTELGDAGEHQECNVVVVGLEDGIKVLECLTVLVDQVEIVDVVEERLVVFIDQDGDLPILAEQLDELLQAPGIGALSELYAVAFGDVEEMEANPFLQIHCPLGDASEIQHDHWPRLPSDFVVDPQSLEEVLVACEDLFQGADHEGLAKPARPGEEIEPSLCDQAVIIFGFIHIDVVVPNQIWEVLNADRKLFLCHCLAKVGDLEKNGADGLGMVLRPCRSLVRGAGDRG